MENGINKGDFSIERIKNFSYSELKKYFENRLKGKITIPSLHTGYDEGPEDFLVEVYECCNNVTKEYIKLIILELLNSVLILESCGCDNSYIGRLLYLCTKFEIYDNRALGVILSLVLSEQFIDKQNDKGDDIHEELLRNLLFIQEKTSDKKYWLSIWNMQFYIHNNKYARTAFTGLYTSNSEAALQKLPHIIYLAEKFPQSYNLKLILRYFIEHCGKESSEINFLNRIMGQLINLQFKHIVYGILQELGYSQKNFKPIPKITQDDKRKVGVSSVNIAIKGDENTKEAIYVNSDNEITALTAVE